MALAMLDRRQCQLFNVVPALRAILAASRGRLDRRQQQRNQNPNDRDHHQQLHEGKTSRFGEPRRSNGV